MRDGVWSGGLGRKGRSGMWLVCVVRTERFCAVPCLPGSASKVLVANGFAFLSGLTTKDRSGGVKEQTADILAQIDA